MAVPLRVESQSAQRTIRPTPQRAGPSARPPVPTPRAPDTPKADPSDRRQSACRNSPRVPSQTGETVCPCHPGLAARREWGLSDRQPKSPHGDSPRDVDQQGLTPNCHPRQTLGRFPRRAPLVSEAVGVPALLGITLRAVDANTADTVRLVRDFLPAPLDAMRNQRPCARHGLDPRNARQRHR